MPPAGQGDGRRGEQAVGELARTLAEALAPGSALVCIGNELRGDDAAGLAVARGLPRDLPWKVFCAGAAPESFLVPVADARPPSVLLVDAVDVSAEPGTVRLLDARELAALSPSTHGPGATAFLRALRLMHDCPCRVLGIQPAGVEFGTEISPPVARAVDRVVRAIVLAAARARGD